MIQNLGQAKLFPGGAAALPGPPVAVPLLLSLRDLNPLTASMSSRTCFKQKQNLQNSIYPKESSYLIFVALIEQKRCGKFG